MVAGEPGQREPVVPGQTRIAIPLRRRARRRFDPDHVRPCARGSTRATGSELEPVPRTDRQDSRRASLIESASTFVLGGNCSRNVFRCWAPPCRLARNQRRSQHDAPPRQHRRANAPSGVRALARTECHPRLLGFHRLGSGLLVRGCPDTTGQSAAGNLQTETDAI